MTLKKGSHNFEIQQFVKLWQQKIFCEIDWSYLCLATFDKFWIWRSICKTRTAEIWQKDILTLDGLEKGLHNGENDSHKRQFLALGVNSQYWILDNLSKKFSCQIDWCYKLLATIWQKNILLSNVNCKVSYLKNKIADKRGQLAF